MNKHGAKWITRKKRLAIYLRDGMACAYCAATIEDDAVLTLDHLVTRSNGGTNHETNLVTACTRCNSNRADRDLSEFADAVAAYLNHGISGEMIRAHVADCSGRNLKPHLAEAQAIIDRRATWGDALREAGRR